MRSEGIQNFKQPDLDVRAKFDVSSFARAEKVIHSMVQTLRLQKEVLVVKCFKKAQNKKW